jgi:GntR family transcriptional regulator
MGDNEGGFRLPKYHNLKHIIRRDIIRGKYKQGEPIPSENELQRIYNVSSTTVRRALSDLVHERLLTRNQGIGTFVNRPPVERNLWRVLSFTDNMVAMGYKPSAKIVSKTLISCPEDIAAELAITKNTKVLVLQRLRYGDDIPMMFEILYIREDLCTGISEKDITGSTFEIYKRDYGYRIASYRQTIQFAQPDESIKSYMGISDEDIPFFTAESTHYEETGIPIEYEKLYYRGDMYRFVIDIRREE